MRDDGVRPRERPRLRDGLRRDADSRYSLSGDDGSTTLRLDGEIGVSGAARRLPPATAAPRATAAFERSRQHNPGSLRRVLERT